MVVDLGTVDCAYFLTFFIGLVWAVFVLITGGSHDVGSPDMDMGGLSLGHVDSFDTGSIDVSPISPITLSTFITTFGGIGIIARQMFHVTIPISLILATIGGFFLSGLMFLFYSKFLIGSQGSSEIQVQRLVGLVAEVITPISQTGVGEIAVVAHGGRVTYPARSSGGVAIRRGTLVVIDQMIGTQALVSPQKIDS
jgi:hypothetical protein